MAEHVAVVVREPADWLPPGRENETVRAVESEGDACLIHHHEAFFNGSLKLTTEKDKSREERRCPAASQSQNGAWINNSGRNKALVSDFISAVINKVRRHLQALQVGDALPRGPQQPTCMTRRVKAQLPSTRRWVSS